MFTLKLKITRNLGLASLRKGQWIVKDMWRWFRNACPAEVQPASHHHSSRRLWDQGSSSAGDFARSWVLKAQRRRNWMPTKEQSTKMEALGNPAPRRVSCSHWGRCKVRPSSQDNLCCCFTLPGWKRFFWYALWISLIHISICCLWPLTVTWRSARCPSASEPIWASPAPAAFPAGQLLQPQCLWGSLVHGCACAAGHWAGQCPGEVQSVLSSSTDSSFPPLGHVPVI